MFGKKNEVVEPVVKQTVIEEGTVFRGELTTKTLLVIRGEFDGQINTDGDVFVAEGGVLKGKGTMKTITVEGTVDADVKCYELAKIAATGKVSGSLATVRLLTDDGSTFDGKLVMIQASKINTEEAGE